MNWTLHDLVLLREVGVQIDQEDLQQAYHWENTHRDFNPSQYLRGWNPSAASAGLPQRVYSRDAKLVRN